MDCNHQQNTQAERNAILSSCCGFLGEATLTDSAVIILFAGMLGAGDMFSMLTTALPPLFNGLFVIPMAFLASTAGKRRLNLISCAVASGAYFLAVSSPFWGGLSAYILILAIVIFAASLTGFIASWFPMVDGFVPNGRRPAFFGRMRFSHQLVATVFLLVASSMLGSHPSVWKLQAVLLLGAIIFSGRMVFISRLPDVDRGRQTPPNTVGDLAAVLKNRPLVGFSIYMFFLNLASCGTVPLAVLMLSQQHAAPANVTLLVSTASLAGMLIGYLAANAVLIRFLAGKTILGIHIAFGFVNLGFVFLSGGGVLLYLMFTVLLFIQGVTTALTSILVSSEMMALSKTGNRILSMAFCSSLVYGGAGGSRFVTSLILGSGMLSDRWSMAGLSMSPYQTVFLIYSVGILLSAIMLLFIPASLFTVSKARIGFVS